MVREDGPWRGFGYSIALVFGKPDKGTVRGRIRRARKHSDATSSKHAVRTIRSGLKNWKILPALKGFEPR